MIRILIIIFVLTVGTSCSSDFRFMGQGFGISKNSDSIKFKANEEISATESFLMKELPSVQSITNDTFHLSEITHYSNTSPGLIPNKIQPIKFKSNIVGKVENFAPRKGIDRQIRNLGKSIAKIGFWSSVIGLISSKLFLFSAAGIILGILSLIYKAKFKTKIYAYLAIILGVLGIVSPVLTTVLLILVTLLLILLTLKWLHWI